MAKQSGDHVIVVHIRPLGTYGRGGPMVDEDLSEATAFVESVVKDLAGDGVEAEAMVATADKSRIGRSLLDIAKERDAGLIAVGTRGRGEATTLVLGSVAHDVIHESEVPVLIVRDLDA